MASAAAVGQPAGASTGPQQAPRTTQGQPGPSNPQLNGGAEEGQARRKRPLQAGAGDPQGGASSSAPVVVDLTTIPDSPSDDEVTIVHEVKRARQRVGRFVPARPAQPRQPIRLDLVDDESPPIRLRRVQPPAPRQQQQQQQPRQPEPQQAATVQSALDLLIASVNPFSPQHLRHAQLEAALMAHNRPANLPRTGPTGNPHPAASAPPPAPAAPVPPPVPPQPQLPPPNWPAAIPLPPPSPEKAGFKCPICFDHVDDTSTTTCGHVFCTPCITECIKTTKKCPKCRKNLTIRQIHKIYLNN